MKLFTKFLFLLTVLFLGRTLSVSAQCNVNEKYDKIVSGYHESIAMKSDGSFAVWGQDIGNDGTADVLTPLSINVTNFPALSGTPLKATIGGKGGGSKEQFFLLTSAGIFAWGARGYVIPTSLTTSTTFQKIGAVTGGDATTRLPSGVAPADVTAFVATYQTLAILTNTGTVWVLTQSSAALQGDNSALSSTTWHKVKKDASTDLTGVTQLRVQASGASYSAFMALTSAGEVYTWGASTYLGNSTASASRSYAARMTLPAEFTASNLPSMIGVTGGVNGSASTKNTYYLLSRSGTLYAMGDNTRKQCGDFTTTERQGWVNVKRSSAANDNFTNINYISVQEHDGSFPGVAAITTTGDLYTWGENGGLMLGRVTDGTTYDPGFPGGFTSGTDKAVSTELGGHTLVYIKEGSSRFCYVGHKKAGSMGDNDATDTNISSFNCSGTPLIDICGYVPIVANVTQSTITAAQTTITANGSSTTTITIRLKDGSGNNLTSSGGVVLVYTSNGTVGTVTDNNDGTYTVVLTSSNTAGTANITFSVNGTTSPNSAAVTFAASLPVLWGNVSAVRNGKTVKVEWSTEQENNVKYFEVERSINGTNWATLPYRIPATNRSTATRYEATDRDYIVLQVFYRVKEVDEDGRFVYSQVKTVYADKGATKISVYPVPTSNRFYLNNVNVSQVKDVKLMNESGNVLRNWKKGEPFYDIIDMPKGVYFIRVELADGTTEQLRISKI